jgi:hypothetical protein
MHEIHQTIALEHRTTVVLLAPSTQVTCEFGVWYECRGLWCATVVCLGDPAGQLTAGVGCNNDGSVKALTVHAFWQQRPLGKAWFSCFLNQEWNKSWMQSTVRGAAKFTGSTHTSRYWQQHLPVTSCQGMPLDRKGPLRSVSTQDTIEPKENCWHAGATCFFLFCGPHLVQNPST